MANDRLRVYFTVDTETSMGGAWKNESYSPLPLDVPVFGRCQSGEYGIPLIMDILEEHGFRGTFFTEVFCAYIVGEREVQKVFEELRRRGHDAQLHLHPAYRFYRDFRAGHPRRQIDLMFTLEPEEQFRLIAEGVELFTQLAGMPPRAYRAGCYGASEVTLKALKASGIEIDSSYNLAQLGATCGFQTRPLNAPAIIDGIYEFPVTVCRTPGRRVYKELEVHAVSVQEILIAIRKMKAAGCRDLVLSLHSFSFLKHTGVRYENCRPDHIVRRRFRKLCAAIAAMKDEVEVAVMGEVDLPSIRVPQPQFAPPVGWFHPGVRKVVQGVNRLPWL